MAWDEEMLTITRVLVNDVAATTYSDDSLLSVILVAAFQVQQELSLPADYQVSVTNGTLTPDPTVTLTKDDSFVNLACIKAACITDRGAAILAAQQAIAVKDGSSAIDLRGVLGGKLKLIEKGWCAVYEDTKIEFLSTNANGIAGAIVMTPFRLYAQGGWTHGNMFSNERQRNFYYM
jgi:hypothetical protein